MGLRAGFFLLFAGFLLFGIHASEILKKRIKKKLDKPFMAAILAIGFAGVIHLAGFLSLWSNKPERLLGPIIYAYIFLWIALSILGYLYKIVPFLWWTHKYSKEIGKKSVPSLKEMINEKTAVPLFSTFIISILLTTASLIIKNLVLFNIGQFFISLSFLGIAFIILSVIKK